MMPGMPAEPIRDPRLSAQNVVPACGSCQGGGDMIFQDKEALMRQIMEAGFAMDDVVLFLDTHPENQDTSAITGLSATCEIRPLPPMKASLDH